MRPSGDIDALHADLLVAGERPSELRRVLHRYQPGDDDLRAVLRRWVPVRLLEVLAADPDWSGRARVMAAVVSHPRTPPALALRLVGSLYWRDQAVVAATSRLNLALRTRAEALLLEQLPRLGLGARRSLARLATPAVLAVLLRDTDAAAVEAALLSPRLPEKAVLAAIRQRPLPPALLEALLSSVRWANSYAVRLELVLQPEMPLPIALAQLSSLRPRDLRQVGAQLELHPLVQRAALRLIAGPPS